MRSGVVSALAVVGLGLGTLGAAEDASAFAIGIELGPQRTGPFGTMSLSDCGGSAKFEIVLSTNTDGPVDESVLGHKATLDEFYFNLPDGFALGDIDLTHLECNGSASCTAELDAGRSVRGGAGARFGFSIQFDAGDVPVQTVQFVLDGVSLNQVLATAMSDPSSTGRGLEVAFALHVTGGGPGAGRGSGSATLGVDPAVVPEPATALLLGLGIAGLAVGGRRARR